MTFFLTPIATPNTLEFMIKYMLISGVLIKICEMTTKPLEYLKIDTRLIPLRPLYKLEHGEQNGKKAFGKTYEWATWGWANVKIDKKKSYINKTNYKYFQKGYGRL
jgi:hypothetical protein